MLESHGAEISYEFSSSTSSLFVSQIKGRLFFRQTVYHSQNPAHSTDFWLGDKNLQRLQIKFIVI